MTEKFTLSNVIKKVLDIFYVLVIVWLGLMALLFLASFINPDSPANQFFVSTIFEISSDDTNSIRFISTDPNAQFEVKHIGWFMMKNANRINLLITMISYYVWWALYLIVIINLRHFFKSLSESNPFISENANRIKWIGIIIISAEIFTHIIEFGHVIYMKSLISSPNAEIFYPPWDFYWEEFRFGIIFAGFAIIAISEIFKAGAKMKEEQSLTI